MRTTFMALALAVLLLGCVENQHEPGQVMSGDELWALLADGRDLRLGGPEDNYIGAVRLEPDGTRKGTGTGCAFLDNGEKRDVTGKWKIEDNQFCREWAYDNKRTCETWIREGPNQAGFLIDGERVGTNFWKN